MCRMPFSSIFDVVINVNLKKALNSGFSVKSDSTAMTFMTDGSCFLFTVNTLFFCHKYILYANTNTSSTKKIISICEEKFPVRRIPAEGFILKKCS